MTEEDRPFPIRSNIVEGESGHGYTLRMATENLLNGLPAVKAMLGKSRFVVLDAADAPRISIWFGADLGLLARALGWTGTGSEPEVYELSGHRLTRSYFLNRSQPRVCGDCLAAGSVCRVSWELSAMTACPTHGRLLIAGCEACGKALRWDRPHMAQCRCGWTLHLSGEPSTDEQLDISGWIEGAFVPSVVAHRPRTPLGRLVEPLSLDAGLHIVYALASMKFERPRHTQQQWCQVARRNSLENSAGVIMHAAGALDCLQRSVGQRGSLRLPSSALELLAEAASCAYTIADRSLAHSLLTATSGRCFHSRWSSRFPQLSQLPLF